MSNTHKVSKSQVLVSGPPGRLLGHRHWTWVYSVEQDRWQAQHRDGGIVWSDGEYVWDTALASEPIPVSVMRAVLDVAAR